MKNKNFYLLLHHVADLLEILAHYSKLFQKRHSIIIEQVDNVVNLKQALRVIGESQEHHLLNGIKKLQCNRRPCTSLNDVETSTNVFLGEYEMVSKKRGPSRSGSRYPPISTKQFDMAKALIDEIESYFPLGNIAMYNILNPRNFPAAATDAYHYGIEEIMKLHEAFYGDESDDEVLTEFVSLWRMAVMGMMTHKDWCKVKNTDKVMHFWTFFLGKTTVIPGLIADLLKKVLVIPIGSADAERAFSIFFHLRTKRRTRLSPKNLYNHLRVRLNGPKDHDAFAAQKYAKWWAEAGNLLTDDPTQVRIQPEPRPLNEEGDVLGDEEKKFLDESTLF